VALTINDLWYRFVQSAVSVANGGTGTGIVASSPQEANGWTSKTDPDTTVAPVQFAVLANVTPTDGAGMYRIQVIYGYGATAEATTADNFQLVKGVGGTSIALLPSSVGVANTTFPKVDITASLAAGEIVKVITNNNASAGAVYKTYLILDRIA
jgi:hypothetical protein